MIALGCGLTDPGACITDFISHTIGPIVGTVFNFTWTWIIGAVAKAIAAVSLLVAQGAIWLWVKFSTPQVQTLSVVNWVQRDELGANGVILAMVAVSIIAAVVRILLSRSGGESAGHVKELGKALITLMVVTLSITTFEGLLIDFGDAYAKWILDQALNGHAMATALKNLYSFDGNLSPFTIIVLGVSAAIVAVFQICAMLFRSAALLLITISVPLGATMTNTEFGMHWFQKSLSYLTMLLMYKPAAASVFALAVHMGIESNTKDPALSAMTAIVMMLMTVLMMPAMMRLLAPASQHG